MKENQKSDDFGIDLNSDFCLKRTYNLERICELVFNEPKKMYEKVYQNFNRAVTDYFLLQRQAFKSDDAVVQRAYLETLSYISSLNEKIIDKL